MRFNKRLVAAFKWCEAGRHRLHVYVMSGDGHTVKIGQSTNLDQRLACMRSHSGRNLRITFTYECVSSRQANRIECAAHALLKEYRVRGEWFRVSAAKAKAAVIEADKFAKLPG